MNIRVFQSQDTQALKAITAVCFDGVAIDQNIERRFGPINNQNWQFRKLRHIDNDIAANPEGIFVAESDNRIIGYISTRIDPITRVGNIANFAVLPEFQKQGIGRRLMTAAIDYLKQQNMACIRIETLEQNPVGTAFYPRMGFQEVARQIHYALIINE